MLRTISSFGQTGMPVVHKPGQAMEMESPRNTITPPSPLAITKDTVHFGAWGNEIDAYTDELMAQKIGHYQDLLDKAPGKTDADKIILIEADPDRLHEKYIHRTEEAHRLADRTIYFQLAGSETQFVLKRTRSLSQDRWKALSIGEKDPDTILQQSNTVKMEEVLTPDDQGWVKWVRSVLYYPTHKTRDGEAGRSENQQQADRLMKLGERLGAVLDKALIERRFNPPPESDD